MDESSLNVWGWIALTVALAGYIVASNERELRVEGAACAFFGTLLGIAILFRGTMFKRHPHDEG